VKVHLITYATPNFRHRQLILGASARANGVVDRVTAFSPDALRRIGFAERFPNLHLHERGSGFWAWKPFIIGHLLDRVADGDIVFYCDVGRSYPFKRLHYGIRPFLDWMNRHGQDGLPGVEIPWDGPMSMWTKRDAFVMTDMDEPSVHSMAPIQASFSFWKADTAAREFVREWTDWCSDRRLVSDDPSVCGLPELPDFRDHRHDQALLTLCCLKHGWKGMSLSSEHPSIDSKDPSEVASVLDPDLPREWTVAGRCVDLAASCLEVVESRLRRGKS
jgi:hypothetical protein